MTLRDKKLKHFHEVTLRFDEEYFLKVNDYTSRGERAPMLRVIIENFLDEHEFISTQVTTQRSANISNVRH